MTGNQWAEAGGSRKGKGGALDISEPRKQEAKESERVASRAWSFEAASLTWLPPAPFVS